MAYQFVHIQTYCPKLMQVSGTKDQFNSTEQVFGEAARDPHYSKHVEGPQRPIAVKNFGAVSVAELRRLHDERRAEIREIVRGSGGKRYQRRLKSDFPTLYTEIHSHPMTAEEYKTASPEAQAQVGAWANTALKDFVSRMPEGVRFAAVVHLDEAHVHFHILAVNMADPKMSANKLHVGKIAAEKWRQENGSSTTLEALPRPKLTTRPNKPRKPKPSKNRATQAKRDAAHAVAVSAWEADCAEVEIANATAVAEWEVENAVHLQAGRKARRAKVEDVDAYQSAMVAFQDRYFEAVGKPCGLLRNGPGMERLSTKQYAARKTRAREMADQAAAQRAVAERNAQEAKRLQDGMERLNADRQALEAAQDAHEKRVVAQEDQLMKREQKAEAMEQELADGIEAISDLVTQAETGEFSSENGKSRLARMPNFIKRLFGTAEEKRSPVQSLFAKVVGLLHRVVSARGAEDPSERTEGDISGSKPDW